jgi:small neutral amino acid transporter SnatA (MarC family)
MNEYLPEARRALSWQIALNSFVLLVASYFAGTYILAFFGISLPIVQVGGGIVLASMGPTGMSVMTKLSSFLLVCIGAQIAWNGIKTLLESVTLHIAP